MNAVILTFHVLIVIGLIVMVLLQRSDGAALGIGGGGGGGGGFMSGRGAANALTRTTSILAAIFFATSLGLAILAGTGESDDSVIEQLTGDDGADTTPTGPVTTTEDLLGTLGGEDDDGAAEPQTEAPLATDGEAPAAVIEAAPPAGDLEDIPGVGAEEAGEEDALAEESPEQP